MHTDGGNEHQAAHTSRGGALRQTHRSGFVHLLHARRVATVAAVRRTCEVDHRINADERIGPVRLRPEAAPAQDFDIGAGGGNGPPSTDGAHAPAARRKLCGQVAPHETGRARDKHRSPHEGARRRPRAHRPISAGNSASNSGAVTPSQATGAARTLAQPRQPVRTWRQTTPRSRSLPTLATR